MRDLVQVLLIKRKAIIDEWIGIVRKNIEINSAAELSFQAVRDSVPSILETIASLLSQAISGQLGKLEQESIDHGLVSF